MKVSPIKPIKPENEPPSHLTASTSRWFRSVVAEYELEQHHIKLLVAACETWDRMQAARVAIDKHGLTMIDPKTGTERARPEINVERDCKIVFMKLLRELNLDVAPPDSRLPKLKY